MRVTLTPIEQRLASYMGRLRNANAERLNLPNRRVSEMGDEEIHIDGIASELAFCRLWNVYPDLAMPDDASAVKSQVDVWLRGFRINVKTTRWPNGGVILAPRHKDEDVDLYALMVGTFPTYEFAGFIFKDDLVQDKYWDKTKNAYYANRSVLCPTLDRPI